MKVLLVFKEALGEVDSVKSNGQITVFGKSLLKRNTEALRRAGFDDISYVTSESFDYSEIAKELGITSVVTPTRLGTGGEAVYASDGMKDGEAVLIMENDSLYRFDLSGISKIKNPTLLCVRENNPVFHASVLYDSDKTVTRFIPKTFPETVCTDTVFSGALVLTKNEIVKLNRDTYCDLEEDVIPRLVGEKTLQCLVVDGDRICFSTCEDIKRFHTKSVKESDLPLTLDKNKNRIEKSVIGIRTTLGKNVWIFNSVIGKDCRIGDNVKLINCLIGEGVTVGDNVCVYDGAVLESGVRVPEGRIIPCNHFVAVGKGNAITVCNRNGFEEYNIRFDRSRITEIPSGDTVYGIGLAVARVFGGTCVVGYREDCHPKALSLISGILSGGCDVLDVGRTDVWIVRYTTRNYGLNFGVYVDEKGITVCEKDGLGVLLENKYKIKDAFRERDERCRAGKYRQLGGTERMYKRKLKHYLYDMPALKVNLQAPSFLSDTVVSLPGSDGETVYVRDTLGAQGFDRVFIDCAVLYAYGKTYGRVYVPSDYVYCAEEIGKKYGFYVERISTEGDERRFLYDMCDPYIRAAVLLRYLAKNDISMRVIRRMLPKVYETEREYDLSGRSDGAVAVLMPLLLQNPTEKGFVYASPSSDLRRLCVRVQSSDAEAAEELCGDVFEKIKNVEKKQLDKQKGI